MYYMEYPSPLGKLLLACEDDGLTGLWMDREVPENGMVHEGHPVFRLARKWLDAYFCGEESPMDIPLLLRGTAFQNRVWERLRKIPYGKTVTYGDIAREIAMETGKRMSAQAVGGAVGSNPISILVPCHRVVGANGKLTGYEWGLERKVWLLSHEGWEGMKYHDNK